MQYQRGPTITVPKAANVGFKEFLRIIVVGGLATLADAADREDGTTVMDTPATGLGSGNRLCLLTRQNEGTAIMTASGPIAAWGDVYADTAGLVSGSPTGVYIGRNVGPPALALNDYVDVLRINDRGGVVYSSTGVSNIVTNTVAETAFNKSSSFGPNTLRVGDVLRIKAYCLVLAKNAAETLALKLKIGTTVLVSIPALNVALNDVGIIDLTVKIRAVGNLAAGLFVAYGTQSLGTPGTATAKPVNLGSTAIDTTVAQAITLTAQWSAANAGNQVELDDLTIVRNGG